MGNIGNNLLAQHVQPLKCIPELDNRLGKLSQLVLPPESRDFCKIIFCKALYRITNLANRAGKVSGKNSGQKRRC